MATSLLLDTDVMIDDLRGHAQAIAFMQGVGTEASISAVSVAELFAGVRDGERVTLEGFIASFDVVPIDSAVARQGGDYRRTYGKSHGVGLADALIAASALVRGATLVTLNGKHFPMLTSVVVPYHKP